MVTEGPRFKNVAHTTVTKGSIPQRPERKLKAPGSSTKGSQRDHPRPKMITIRAQDSKRTPTKTQSNEVKPRMQTNGNQLRRPAGRAKESCMQGTTKEYTKGNHPP